MPCVICCLKGPTTTRKTFINPEGMLVFPNAEEKYWPYHSGLWHIKANNHNKLILSVTYDVATCTNCTCDIIKVNSGVFKIDTYLKLKWFLIPDINHKHRFIIKSADILLNHVFGGWSTRSLICEVYYFLNMLFCPFLVRIHILIIYCLSQI